MTLSTSSKAIGSDTFEIGVVTKGLHKILTMKLGLYRLTAMRDARAKIDNNPGGWLGRKIKLARNSCPTLCDRKA